MKNLKVIISSIALTVFMTTTVLASTTTEITAKNNLRIELVSLLGDQSDFVVNGEALKANVSFMINEDNEIVVIHVDCKTKSVCSFVKGKLNYKKINAIGIEKGKVYIMPLKIEG